MNTTYLYAVLFSFITTSLAAQNFEIDKFKTANGSLEITFIGHGSLMMKYNDQIIHVDPSSREADYSQLPDADLILITHHHGDHADPKAFGEVNSADTQTYLTALAKEKINTGDIVENGMSVDYGSDIKIEAIPAYNLVHKRDNGEPFHKKGECNSYVLNIDGLRVFVGGDTENTPEMKALKDIDIAFLPMNLPYTMTPEMVADAAKAFKPKILYPYHFGQTNVDDLLKLMNGVEGVEVRVRDMP